MLVRRAPRDDDGCGWWQLLPELPPARRLAGDAKADCAVVGAGFTGLAASADLSLPRRPRVQPRLRHRFRTPLALESGVNRKQHSPAVDRPNRAIDPGVILGVGPGCVRTLCAGSTRDPAASEDGRAGPAGTGAGRAVSDDAKSRKLDTGGGSPHPLELDAEYRSHVLAAAPVAVIAVDLEGVVTLAERSGLRSRDRDLAGLPGQSLFTLFKSDPTAVRHWKRALAGERFLAVTRHGGVEFDARFGPIEDAAGARIGAVAVWLPITERERAVAALRESEARFRALTEQASDVIAEVEADSRFLYVSPRFTDLLGYTEDQLVGRPALELIHPDDVGRVQPLQDEAVGNKRPLELLCRLRHVDGSWRWMEIVGRRFRTADGDVRGVLVGRDVNARVEIEAALRAQREVEARIAVLTRRFLALGSDADEIGDAIQESLQAAAEIAHADRCFLISLTSDGVERQQLFKWESEGIPARMLPLGQWDRERYAWAYEKLSRGDMLRVPSVSALPSEAEALREGLTTNGLRSLLAIPVLVNDRLHSVLGFESGRCERDWSEQEIVLLRLVAEFCSSALRRRGAEQALGESETRFRALMENAQDAICEIRADGRFLYANPRFSEMTGFSSEEIESLDAYSLIHPDDLGGSGQRDLFGKVGMRGGTALYRGRRSDGSWRWFEASGRAYRSASGELRSTAVIRDATERMESQQALQRKLQLEELIANLSRGFLDLKPDEIDEGIREGLTSVGRLSQVDRGFLISIDPGRSVVLQCYEYLDESVESVALELDATRADQHPALLEGLLRGEVLYVSSPSELPPEAGREAEVMKQRNVRSFLGIPLLSGNSLVGLLGFESVREERAWSDESIALLRLVGEIFVSALRRKQAEQALQESRSQLLQAQKMEAVGTLAGGVAHDFNNQLSVILGNARYVTAQVGEDPELADALGDLQRAGMHCAQLTRSLLAFSRQTPASPQPIAVERVVAEVRELLQPLIPASIEFETETHNSVDCVLADPTQLQQVLVNLAVNARDAMPNGGRLRIATERRRVDREAAARLGLEGAGKYVEFIVQDDGVGMDEETASRVFDPFFTTKEFGKGTGLGLATVYGILQESKGTVGVESRPGQGTTFRALLPRSDEDVSEHPLAVLDEPQSTGETILLVEDEPAVRRLLRRFLASRGYEVLEAANGVDALRVSGVHRGSIEALVTDIVMPRMDGQELAARLLEERPGLRVLFLSGYSEDEPELPGSQFLSKPFSQNELLSEVRALLDADRERE